MRTFEKGNWSSPETLCPICKTQDKGEVVLVPIAGTEDGNNMEAIQVHTKCIGEKMIYIKSHNAIIINCKH